MKKLSIIKLKESAGLTQDQMKRIAGGYYTSDYCHQGEYLFTCKVKVCYSSFTGVVCAKTGIAAAAKSAAAHAVEGCDNEAECW